VLVFSKAERLERPVVLAAFSAPCRFVSARTHTRERDMESESTCVFV
jgi:hypothetical protein